MPAQSLPARKLTWLGAVVFRKALKRPAYELPACLDASWAKRPPSGCPVVVTMTSCFLMKERASRATSVLRHCSTLPPVVNSFKSACTCSSVYVAQVLLLSTAYSPRLLLLASW